MSRRELAAVAIAAVLAGATTPASAWDLRWLAAVTGTGTDTGTSTAADETGVYLSGTTDTALPGQIALGDRDIFLRKHAFDGTILWTRQLGTSALEFDRAVVAHGGHVYLAGRTMGTLPGQTSAGSSDVFVQKYTPQGELIWTRQLGTPQFEAPFGLAASDRGLYVAGGTFGTFPGQPAGSGEDTFLARLDAASGIVDWVLQLGLRAPFRITTGGVAADDSGVYLASNTVGSAPLRKYDHSGHLVWNRDVPDLGECNLFAFSVAAHSGQLYLAGQAQKSFLEHRPTCDPASAVVGGVRRYSGSDGALVWQRVVEAPPVEDEFSFTGAKMVTASARGVFVAANTTATFRGGRSSEPRPDYSQCTGLGDPTFGDRLDAYVRRYDLDGNILWTRQFGSTVFDLAFGLAATNDTVYASGDNSCQLLGQPYGGGARDAFLVALAVDPRQAPGRVQVILGFVETLRESGRLQTADFETLVAPLEAALDAVDAGQAAVAIEALDAFIDAARGLRQARVITAREEERLSKAARAVQNALRSGTADTVVGVAN
jgi:hypothetical protein